jgi:hypothetical protein
MVDRRRLRRINCGRYELCKHEALPSDTSSAIPWQDLLQPLPDSRSRLVCSNITGVGQSSTVWLCGSICAHRIASEHTVQSFRRAAVYPPESLRNCKAGKEAAV